MPTLTKIARFAAIALALLFIILSLGGVIAGWFVSQMAGDITLKAFGVIEAGVSHDPLMVTQAWTFVACVLGGGIWFLRRYADGVPADETGQYANDVATGAFPAEEHSF